MKKKWLVLLILSLALIAGGCAAASPGSDRAQLQVAEVEKMAAAPDESGYVASDVDDTLAIATQDRMIIYTVDMEIIVKDTVATLSQVENLSAEMGGFVSESSSWKDEGQLRARVTLRVPAGRLDEALARVRDLALDIERESRDSDDVTDDFTDLEARLRTKRAYEEELLELLETRQEATGDTEAILEVYRELTRIRGEIEQIQGRMNSMSNLAAMATIHLVLTPDALMQPITVGTWQPQGTARQAIRALINALQFVVDATIWILIFMVPMLIVILLPLFLIFRAIFIWRRKRRQPAA